MSMINIDELHQQQNKKKNQKKKVFEDILKMCHNRIKKTAKTEDNRYCFFRIPIYIYGIPIYDMNACIVYVTTALSKNGFDIRYFHPNIIFISWQGKTNKSIKSESNKFIQPKIEYKTLKNYKSSDNFKSSDNYKPLNNYKPSGNFVYNKTSNLDLFNKNLNKLF